MKTIIGLGLAASALAGCVAVANETRIAEQPVTPQQIVAARQAAFHLSGATMGNFRGVVERGGDVAGQAYAARGLARWAAVLPTLFPDETASIVPSRARPEVWMNKADFNAKAAAYAAAASRLAEIAAAGDKQAFAAQVQATAATCKACHDLYQVPQN